MGEAKLKARGFWAVLWSPVGAGFFTFLLSKILISWLFLGRIVCRDGWPSSSVGIQGACSHHGGVDYGPTILVSLISIVFGVAVGLWRHSQELAKEEEQQRIRLERVQREQEDIKATAIRDGIACPLCGFPMRRRLARRGKNKGKFFWGCSRYPRCKGGRSLTHEEETKQPDE